MTPRPATGQLRPNPRRRTLERLAMLVGIEVRYTSVTGKPVDATDAAIEGILAALGFDASNEAALESALADATAERDGRFLEPVVVVRPDRHRPVLVGPVTATALRTGSAYLRLESGEERTVPLRRLETDRGARSDRRRSIDLSLLDLPIGYHSLRIEAGGTAAHASLIVRPGKAHRPSRSFGVFAPVYGLRSESDWGIGSTTELAVLGRWAAERGASFVGTLPLYPAFYGERFEVSPYRPVSRVAWNEIFLDPATLPEVVASPEAPGLLSSRRLRRVTKALREGGRVDYAKVFAEKQPVIEACALAVEHGPRRAAFEAFLVAHPETKAYALFRANRDGGSPEEQWRSVRYYQYGQFAMDAALSQVVADDGIPLYLDLPLGVHPDGFDPAHYPTAFLSGASVGSPPDDFFAGGQNWGLPPLDPHGIRDGEYAYVRAVFSHICRHASVVRIDHVMGLERCFVIPEGADGGDGAYLRYPSDELRAVAAIEAERAGVTLVGEDLGTVPVATHAAMRRDGMLRSAVYQFAATPSQLNPPTRADSLASFGTHDQPRFAHFVTGADVTERVGLGEITRAEGNTIKMGRKALRDALVAAGDGERGNAKAYRAMLAWLGSTKSDLALVDLGDLVGDPEPENRPGPHSGETSWRHRLPVRMEELDGSHPADARIAIVADGRPTRSDGAR